VSAKTWSSAVDVHIRRLRAKLDDRGPVISTVRGIGYRLDRRNRVAVIRDAGGYEPVTG
jgi:DNA-binding response OmpR family regulator